MVISKKVVCIGDSLTLSYGATYPYPTRLQSRLHTHSLEWEVVNAGVVGNTSGSIRARFAADVVALTPEYAVIMAGTNDIWYGYTLTIPEANITLMCNYSVAAGIIPIVCNIPPMGGSSETRANVTALNAWITSYTATNGYRRINFFTPLDDSANPGDIRPEYLYIAMHPNDAGYKAMVESIDIIIFNLVDAPVDEITATCEVSQQSSVSVGWNV